MPHRSIRRCSACGHRLSSPPPPECPLCAFEFADDRVTGVDVTPYAVAYSLGVAGWRKMCVWVWLSGWERLKHLALIRDSAASRRFAFWNVLLLTLGLGVFQLSVVGWRSVTASPTLEPTGSTQPGGNGWVRVAAAPRPFPPDWHMAQHADLWWNPARGLIAASGGMVAGLLLMLILLAWMRSGAGRAHHPSFRAERRMTAAIHYSTAWGLPLLLATLVGGLRPWSLMGAIGRWPWCPTERLVTVSASVLATSSIVMWWFWLIRLATTAPKKTRVRVVLFWAIGAPLMLGGAAGAWWWGLDAGLAPFFTALDLDF